MKLDVAHIALKEAFSISKFSALAVACVQKNLDHVKLLVDYGVDPNGIIDEDNELKYSCLPIEAAIGTNLNLDVDLVILPNDSQSVVSICTLLVNHPNFESSYLRLDRDPVLERFLIYNKDFRYEEDTIGFRFSKDEQLVCENTEVRIPRNIISLAIVAERLEVLKLNKVLVKFYYIARSVNKIEHSYHYIILAVITGNVELVDFLLRFFSTRTKNAIINLVQFDHNVLPDKFQNLLTLAAESRNSKMVQCLEKHGGSFDSLTDERREEVLKIVNSEPTLEICPTPENSLTLDDSPTLEYSSTTENSSTLENKSTAQPNPAAKMITPVLQSNWVHALKKSSEEFIKNPLAFIEKYRCTPLGIFNLETLYGVQVSDREVIVGNGENKRRFALNSKILKTRSNFFASAFNSVMLENRESTYPIPDIDPDAFEIFAKWLYDPSLTITHDNFKALAAMSNRFVHHELQKNLRGWINAHPECENWSSKLNLHPDAQNRDKVKRPCDDNQDDDFALHREKKRRTTGVIKKNLH